MENKNTVSIGDFVTESMTHFGKEVNTNRQLPHVLDGLKPVYRRIIYETLTNNVGSMTKTAAIAGRVIATTHPHSDSSVVPPISNLVRWNILEGQGNHGLKSLMGDDIDAAAPRYTEAKISSKYLNIFKEFMPYVEYVDAEMPGYKEPKYLPSPIPLCLSFSTLGIGIGVNTRVPAFTVHSMMEALMKDDPNLLEAPFGLKLVKEACELTELWNIGIGKVAYSYDVFEGRSESGSGTYIQGEAELFKPNLSKLKELKDMGRIFINNETDKTGSRIFIGRNYNVKSISYDQIFEMAQEASKYCKTYRLTVSDGEKVFLTPLKEWLRTSYENYIKVIERYKSDKVEKFKFDYEVFKYLPQVVELLYNDRNLDSDKIAKKLKIDREIVSEILKKSINTLRNADSGEKKLKSIQEKIDYFIKLDPKVKIKELINAF